MGGINQYNIGYKNKIMIKNIYFENYYSFEKKVELNLEADNYTKKFPHNVSKEKTIKTAVIYGPNNTGKTALIEGAQIIKNVLLDKDVMIRHNIFTKEENSKFGITFILEKKCYNYEFWINVYNQVTYEKFSIKNDNKEEIIFIKDNINKKYRSCDKKLVKILPLAASDNILIYTINSDNFKILKEAKRILITIASQIEVVDMNNISNRKTIEILKNKDELITKVVSFIKNADLFLEDYYYDEKSLIDITFAEKLNKENKLENLVEQTKLISVYKGIKVPSIFFDSVGTKKIVALASYIIEALEYGKILFVDELDSSLHFKLTRAIISMFNNVLNTKAQLICTIHDTDLLDCQKMFRKEQIWFTDKDENGAKMYSLKDFSYDKTGIRETTNILEKYNKGLLGAIPKPNLISSLLDEAENEDS